MDILTLQGDRNIIYINGATAERTEVPTDSPSTPVSERFAELFGFYSELNGFDRWMQIAHIEHFEKTLGREISEVEADDLLGHICHIFSEYQDLMKVLAGRGVLMPRAEKRDGLPTIWGHRADFIDFDMSDSADRIPVLVARYEADQAERREKAA